jgi:hypothetical protein
MRTNRYVPLIIGLLCISAAAWIFFAFSGWWRFVAAVALLAIGWPSLKTAIFASDREVRELTGSAPMSEDTRTKFRDRV